MTAPKTDADVHTDVDVAVDTVTVSGTVDTWREHEAVLASARDTPGVREVVDRLRVDPYAHA